MQPIKVMNNNCASAAMITKKKKKKPAVKAIYWMNWLYRSHFDILRASSKQNAAIINTPVGRDGK